MKIVMVASESNPLIKTGGLGDVVYSLSKELAILKEDVSICLPFYSSINKHDPAMKNLKQISSISINMSWRNETCLVYETSIEGVKFYLFQNQHYFERYGSIYGFGDDGERFACFTLAVAKFLALMNDKPDIINIHDWQPGMLPVIVRENEWMRNQLSKSKFVLTIHNPAFQGLYDRSILGDLYNLSDHLFDGGKVRFKGAVSTLKASIEYVDMITTVSPTHALELLSSEGSMGLNEILNAKKDHFYGILNGIDYLEFDPKHDKLIYENFDFATAVKGKKANKDLLCQELGLNKDLPLFGFVSRMTWQKGMTLVYSAIEYIVNNGGNVVILGSGEYEIEQYIEKLRYEYPNNISIYIGFNNERAHKIYASSDFFLMPSLFEPCGIGQMIAQRYGTLPIVRETGGLKDSVIGYQKGIESFANGYSFFDFSDEAIDGTCKWALMNYYDTNVHQKLMKNAMLTDNSWKKSAKLYLKVYNMALCR